MRGAGGATVELGRVRHGVMRIFLVRFSLSRVDPSDDHRGSLVIEEENSGAW